MSNGFPRLQLERGHELEGQLRGIELLRRRRGRPRGVKNGEGVTGQPQVKKLKPIHLKIMAHHLAGLTNIQVGQLCGVTPQTVSNTIRDPLVQEVLARAHNEFDDIFKNLYPEVVAAMRDGLRDEDPNVRLSAARTWLQSHGKLKPKEENQRNVTAEDVVAQLLKAVEQGGTASITVSKPQGALPDFHSPMLEGEAVPSVKEK